MCACSDPEGSFQTELLHDCHRGAEGRHAGCPQHRPGGSRGSSVGEQAALKARDVAISLLEHGLGLFVLRSLQGQERTSVWGSFGKRMNP